ncbi:TPA: hypothetical protein N0F65_003226 [Lagenidium giganteum]|uniref:ATP-dependent DNA helicase n=1 Tax=Lagenidium giganteum TaxID=4803 RepID=A0AAV2Z7T3_9STRA|nr:TPA: hypothetical protein N0F65_003226 [Lagenidium giganteum]
MVHVAQARHSPTFIAQFRASQKVIVATASSGIAFLLLEGGRTAQSVFTIPIPIDAIST